ncbi:hypothetical protein BZA77DRAFT_387834 [Pyronema omphalodes]|nr:hypothetical protein BZA77DRAFT_387834 [Pyronema omphalodes]
MTESTSPSTAHTEPDTVAAILSKTSEEQQKQQQQQQQQQQPIPPTSSKVNLSVDQYFKIYERFQKQLLEQFEQHLEQEFAKYIANVSDPAITGEHVQPTHADECDAGTDITWPASIEQLGETDGDASDSNSDAGLTTTTTSSGAGSSVGSSAIRRVTARSRDNSTTLTGANNNSTSDGLHIVNGKSLSHVVSEQNVSRAFQEAFKEVLDDAKTPADDIDEGWNATNTDDGDGDCESEGEKRKIYSYNRHQESSKRSESIKRMENSHRRRLPTKPPSHLTTPLLPPLSRERCDQLKALANVIVGEDRAGKRMSDLAYVPAKEKETVKEEEVKLPRVRGSKLEYKRMDELYNKERHDYYLTDTTTDKKSSDDVWEEYSFIVRRTFNWKNEYQKTMIDIKSEELVSVLRKVMKDVRMINLSSDKPVLEPNLLFNYLPDFQTVLKKENEQPEDLQNKKKINHLNVLINYLLEDYAPITKALYPLLEEGRITFDHLWAVSDQAPSSTHYKGKWFQLDCTYINYDGKSFGEAKATVKIPEFVGVKRIDSLLAFPLARHPEVETVREKLINRGRKFGTYSGSHYKYYEGMAYFRTQEGITKLNVRSRIMVDALTFRKMNPDYGIQVSNPEDSDSEEDFGTPSNSTSPWKSVPSSENPMDSLIGSAPALSYKVTSFGIQVVRADAKKERKTGVPLDPKDMTVEQLLICPPTIPGFSLGDKIYLHFAVDNIRDIVFNKTAFDSLVLPEKKKSIVKALVETHTKNKQGKKKPGIDDIIKGKGQGLVVVLHGRPGVGKTLTAEGISESLQLPLYMIGTSQLSTTPEKLDAQLTQILEVAHGWGAVLLLDEADVFLERRSVHDIHRNALVCVFLRQLEYFQGILFMTTNRMNFYITLENQLTVLGVETFDEAFQSRIHIALRYSDLDNKARHAVWTQFLDMVSHEEVTLSAENNSDNSSEAIDQTANDNAVETAVETVKPRKILTQEQLNTLSRKNLNGRQIKNIVRTAQALAYSMGEDLSLKHIMEVLEVTEEFEHDLKGTGQIDGMMSYA